jgi:hypothetical protein
MRSPTKAPEHLTFSSGDVSAPTGPPAPTATEVQVMGAIGGSLGKRGRATLMNQIGLVVGIPAGGWHNQAKLFEDGDVRLSGLLHIMSDEHKAQLVADNLGRVARFTRANIMMAVVIAAREHDTAVTAHGTKPINTYYDGGLDFLGRQKDQLGLPRAVTKHWKPLDRFENLETHNYVYPAEIPARDQMMAYAAQEAASFQNNFVRNLRSEFGGDADAALAGASRGALLVWQAYVFLAPGGRHYDPKKKLADQLGQAFGHRSALGFFGWKARDAGRKPSLNEVITERSLDHLVWLQSAKTRTAETLFLERLLKRARQLLPH